MNAAAIRVADPYAEAIADGAAINRCPPGGGQATIAALARVAEIAPVAALDPELQPMDAAAPSR